MNDNLLSKIKRSFNYGLTGRFSVVPIKDKKILSSSRDSSIKIWNLESDNSIIILNKSFEGIHRHSVWAIDYYNGNFVSGSADKTVKVWQNFGENITTLSGHASSVRNVVIAKTNPDIVVSGCIMGEVIVWNSSEGSSLYSLTMSNSNYVPMFHQPFDVVSIVQNKHYLIIAFANKIIRIFDIRSIERELKEILHIDLDKKMVDEGMKPISFIKSITLSADSRTIYVVGHGIFSIDFLI